MIYKCSVVLLLSIFLISKVYGLPSEILVKYQANASLFHKSQRLNIVHHNSSSNWQEERRLSGNVYQYQHVTSLPAATLHDLLAELNANPAIAFAEINYRRYPSVIPNDPHFSLQWALTDTNAGINMTDAWNINTGSTIVVAVIDSGQLEHSDMNNRYVAGYDFISSTGNDLNGNPLDNDGDPGRDNDPSDPGDSTGYGDCEPLADGNNSSWHGLSVSSIIAANANNNLGISGINWSAAIMPIRALGRCGGTDADIADAIRWAAGVRDNDLPNPPNQAAQIINLSFGGAGPCTNTLQNAIDDAIAKGASIIVAAGNESDDVANYAPANCDNVITVAASNRDTNATNYTNIGEKIDIIAPGGSSGINNGIIVLSNNGTTSPTDEIIASTAGTSFAAPMVSGVASLIYAINPSVTPSTLASILQRTSSPFPSGSNCSSSNCGSGLLNAYDALRFAESNGLFGTSTDTINFSTSSQCVREPDNSITLQLNRSGSGLGEISVSIVSQEGSALSGLDFTAVDTLIHWADGDLDSKFITIPIADDFTQESAEAFTLILAEVSSQGQIGEHNNVTITIQSDDNTPAICAANETSGSGAGAWQLLLLLLIVVAQQQRFRTKPL